MSQIYLFTACYPYEQTECFLEDEISILSQEFDKITIIPLYGNKVTRMTPYNCSVVDPIEHKGIKRYLSLLRYNRATYPFLKDFFKNRVYLSLARFKSWIIAYNQVCCLLQSDRIQAIFRYISPSDICYFYWGKGSISLIPFFSGKAKFVARFHGEWDLWEESSGNYAPFRQEIVNGLDLAFFISKKGEVYFRNKYAIKATKVSPLGSYDNGVCSRSEDGVLRVVSCSSVYPLKRVFLILDSLLLLDIKIEWTHIGGGPMFQKLAEQVGLLTKENLKIQLLGHVNHREVVTFYQTHKVDLFINLSENEGVPVSIMEAISFDIPVLATDVGATSEIVIEKTGVLIDANPSAEEVSTAIKDIKGRLNSIHPRGFWECHYNAENNYREFAKTLKDIK